MSKQITKHCGGVHCPFEYSCIDGCLHPKSIIWNNVDAGTGTIKNRRNSPTEIGAETLAIHYLRMVHNVELTHKEFGILIREYNNYEMPLSKRVIEIMKHPLPFIKFLSNK